MIQRELLENALDNLPYGIYIVDSLGNYIFANTVYVNMVKIPKEKLLAYNVYSLKKNKEINICITEKVCKLKKRIVMFQDVEIKGHEHYKQIVASSPILDMNGNVVCVIALCIPVENINYLYQEAIHNEARSFIKLPSSEALESNNIVAVSPVMKNIMNLADTLAPLDTTVIILGESGTGKEVLAKYIHEKSQRASKEMVIINCASLPESLLESELFGYEKGAFTGASSQGKKGLFEVANDSTLFLDEINSLPLALQGKILRAIETKTISRIGSTVTRKVNFRLITATNEDLLKMVHEKRFREDLYYRLNIVPIYLPPLCERKEDILPLVEYFRKYYCNIYNKTKVFSQKTLKAILDYNWPGNIRELRNFVERSFIMITGEIIELSNIAPLLFIEQKYSSTLNDADSEVGFYKNSEIKDQSLNEYLEECEKKYIQYALEKCGSTYKTAEFLKTSQTMIARKKKKYNL